MKAGQPKLVEVLLILGGIAVVLVATFVGPGCGTLENQRRVIPQVYGGVREELRYFPISLIDLPCSLVGDTVMLRVRRACQLGREDERAVEEMNPRERK